MRGCIGQRRRERRKPKVYLPLEFDPGTDAQVDWGEAVAEIAGEWVTVQVFYMRLCYSRRLFIMAFQLALEYGCAHLDGVSLCLHQLQQPVLPLPVLDLSDRPQLSGIGLQPLDLGCYDQLLSWK